MNESSKHCEVFVVIVLLFLEVLFFAGSSFAFVTNKLSKTMTTTQFQQAATTYGTKPQRGTSAAVPLIAIATRTDDSDDDSSALPSRDTSRALVSALRESGFALVQSPLLTPHLQSKALEAASRFLAKSSSSSSSSSSVITEGSKDNDEIPVVVDVISHPTDPKVYAMLDAEDQFDLISPDKIIKEYVHALRSIKIDVLRHIAVGLDVDDVNFFAKLHDENNDTLRLITYFPTHSENTGNRCKEHSDYGTITLLSTDGVSGLELFHEGKWLPVPYVEGALVVNVGSLLAGWTKGVLRATLHRVAGPASLNSGSNRQVLLEAVNHSRTSLAFFADPNHDVSESLAATAATTEKDDLTDALGGISVAEYIRWRSGGDGVERSGVSFTANEKQCIDNEKG